MRKKIGAEDQFIHFRWKVGFISSNEEEASWVVGELWINSQQITKSILNFVAKAWWTLVRQILSPTSEDNVLCPNRAAIIAGYELDVAHFNFKEIHI